MAPFTSIRDPVTLAGILGDPKPAASRANVLLGVSASLDMQPQNPEELEEDDIWPRGVAETTEKSVRRVSSKENVGKLKEFDGLAKPKVDGIEKLRLPLRNLEKGHCLTGGSISDTHRLSVGGAGFARISEFNGGNCNNVRFQAHTPSWMIPQGAMEAPPKPAGRQSLPVSVPAWPPSLSSGHTNRKKIDWYIDSDDDDRADERLPPHELLAKEYAENQRSSFSVCEGIGRTLKGRDLSRVRDAVWSEIGFAD